MIHEVKSIELPPEIVLVLPPVDGTMYKAFPPPVDEMLHKLKLNQLCFERATELGK